MSSGHIPALDAVRGIAALLVVFTHVDLLPRQFGGLGVSIFFVLSGFLITWLLFRENDETGYVSLRNFYLRRSLRIFPAFYVFWAASICATLIRGARVVWPEAWASFFYMGDYYAALALAAGAGASTIMGITWSLAVEEKFYLVWPWLFRKFRNRENHLFWICVVTILAGWLYRIIVSFALVVPRDYLRYAFEARIDNILFGALAAISVRRGLLSGFLARIGNRGSLAAVSVVLIAGLAILESHVQPVYQYVFGMSFDAFLIAVLLLQLIAVSDQRPWNWLESPVFRYLGRISYSLYLYHFLVILTVPVLTSQLRYRYQLGLELVISVLLATASYELIERPFLRLKRRFEPFLRTAADVSKRDLASETEHQ